MYAHMRQSYMDMRACVFLYVAHAQAPQYYLLRSIDKVAFVMVILLFFGLAAASVIYTCIQTVLPTVILILIRSLLYARNSTRLCLVSFYFHAQAIHTMTYQNLLSNILLQKLILL